MAPSPVSVFSPTTPPVSSPTTPPVPVTMSERSCCAKCEIGQSALDHVDGARRRVEFVMACNGVERDGSLATALITMDEVVRAATSRRFDDAGRRSIFAVEVLLAHSARFPTYGAHGYYLAEAVRYLRIAAYYFGKLALGMGRTVMVPQQVTPGSRHVAAFKYAPVQPHEDRCSYCPATDRTCDSLGGAAGCGGADWCGEATECTGANWCDGADWCGVVTDCGGSECDEATACLDALDFALECVLKRFDDV